MGRRSLPKRLTPLINRHLIQLISWGISSPFELLSPTSGQVTNALLTRSPLGTSIRRQKFLVRLACIKHAASVHPEPGSNSPQKFTPLLVLLLSFITQLNFRCTSFHSSVVKVPFESRGRFYHITLSCQGVLKTKPPMFPTFSRQTSVFSLQWPLGHASNNILL